MKICRQIYFGDQEINKSIDDIIDEFHNKEQIPFLGTLQEELDTTMKVDQSILLSSDAFNVNAILAEKEKAEELKTFLKFNGIISKSFVFQEDDNLALLIVATTELGKERAQCFFDGFEIAKEKAIKNLNNKVK